jgi:plasmid replication initiation protein
MKSEDGQNEMRTRFIATAKFDHHVQEATLYFAAGILPYISQLKDNFTRYRVENMVQLTSTHAIRVYELIVMWAGQNQSSKELEIDKFKELLGLDLKYKQTGDLNKFVITPVIEQINERTDYELEISLRKVGRSFKFIQHRFKRKSDAVAKDLQRQQRKIKNTAKPKSQKAKKESNPLKGIKDLDAFYKKHKLGVESMDETFKRLRKEAAEGTFSLNPTD